MNSRYLEVTYRSGKPMAAYFYLARRSGDYSAKVHSVSATIKVDLAEDGRPIGIELLDPRDVSLESLNQIMRQYSLPDISDKDLLPLKQAA